MGRIDAGADAEKLYPVYSTYAGFENESQLLWDLYKQVVGKDEHPEGQGERLHPDLPIYANREARIFCYWGPCAAHELAESRILRQPEENPSPGDLSAPAREQVGGG